MPILLRRSLLCISTDRFTVSKTGSFSLIYSKRPASAGRFCFLGSAPGSGAGLKAWPSLRVRCSGGSPKRTLKLRAPSRLLDQRRAAREAFNMAVAVERLAQEALALSDQERAELARKLLVSLEGPPDEGVDAAWDMEIKERVDRIREGTAKGRPAEEVFRDIRARYE